MELLRQAWTWRKRSRLKNEAARRGASTRRAALPAAQRTLVQVQVSRSSTWMSEKKSRADPAPP